MSFIAGVLNNLFRKTVPDFAVVLLVASLAFIFKKRVRLVLKTARLAYLDKKEFLMSRAARPRLAALAAALLLLFLVPFSRETLTSEGVLSPAVRLRVEAPEDGRVDEVLVRESDAVREGDVLVRMSSAALAVRSPIAGRVLMLGAPATSRAASCRRAPCSWRSATAASSSSRSRSPRGSTTT